MLGREGGAGRRCGLARLVSGGISSKLPYNRFDSYRRYILVDVYSRDLFQGRPGGWLAGISSAVRSALVLLAIGFLRGGLEGLHTLASLVVGLPLKVWPIHMSVTP